MFGFVKQVIIWTMMFVSSNILEVNPLKCISMSNHECKARSKILNINSIEPSCYPYSFKINKCSGSCNNINDPYAKLSNSDVVKNTNTKIFNLELMKCQELMKQDT